MRVYRPQEPEGSSATGPPGFIGHGSPRVHRPREPQGSSATGARGFIGHGSPKNRFYRRLIQNNIDLENAIKRWEQR